MSKASDLIGKFSVLKAHNAQMRLCQKVVTKDKLPNKINLIAGVDVAYVGDIAIGAVAVLAYDTLQVLETQTSITKAKLPYIPTLLSFREIPPAIASIRELKLTPDVFLVDGQGLAHPYRCGFASHLGLAAKKPTIGIAKSILVGKPTIVGKNTFLIHNGQIVGVVIVTKENVKPVYVSIGHLISLETAIQIVKHCVRNYRIPEPIRHAHNLASQEREHQKSLQKTL